MAQIQDGKLIHAKVTLRIVSGIEKGPMSIVRAIVVHQTGGATAESTFTAYENGGNGAHFLISKDGRIYQTARVSQQCHHVGKLKSRCLETKTCDAVEAKAIDGILHQKGKSYSQRVRELHQHELEKAYPSRYPSNEDSIGIELVGRVDPKTKRYEPTTSLQDTSLKWLRMELQEHLMLASSEMFRHPEVSYKQPTEAESARW